MLWFLLFGVIGYLIYKICKRRWFRSLQREIANYKDVRFRTLGHPDKQRLRKLVNDIFKSGMTLDEDTNAIVGKLYQEIEQEDFYRQGGLGLSEVSNEKRPNP